MTPRWLIGWKELDGIERHLWEELGDHRVRHAGHQQAVAVRRRPRDGIGGDGRAGAGLVVDQHRLAERVRHVLGENAGDHVDRAARSIGYGDAHRLVRIDALSVGDAAQACQQHNGSARLKNVTAIHYPSSLKVPPRSRKYQSNPASRQRKVERQHVRQAKSASARSKAGSGCGCPGRRHCRRAHGDEDLRVEQLRVVEPGAGEAQLFGALHHLPGIGSGGEIDAVVHASTFPMAEPVVNQPPIPDAAERDIRYSRSYSLSTMEPLPSVVPSLFGSRLYAVVLRRSHADRSS